MKMNVAKKLIASHLLGRRNDPRPKEIGLRIDQDVNSRRHGYARYAGTRSHGP